MARFGMQAMFWIRRGDGGSHAKAAEAAITTAAAGTKAREPKPLSRKTERLGNSANAQPMPPVHQQGFVLDDQHTHKCSMLRAGAYRRHIEKRIRAGNTTVP
jgi:hypothetical protein